MELTEIIYKKSNLEVEIEKNTGGSYSISIRTEKLPEEPYEKPFVYFRTDEISIDDLIEVLTFAKNYNFIQETKNDKE